MSSNLRLGHVVQNLHGHKFIQDLVGGQVTEIRSLTNDLGEMLLVEKHSRDELPFDPIIIGVLASMIRHIIGKSNQPSMDFLGRLSFISDKVINLILDLVKFGASNTCTSH